MNTKRFLKVKRALVAVVVAGSAVAMAPGIADARINSSPKPIADTVEKMCWGLQQDWDRLKGELEHASKYGTQADYDAVMGEMRSTLDKWNSSCKGYYGSIMFRRDQWLGVLVTTTPQTELSPTTETPPTTTAPLVDTGAVGDWSGPQLSLG